MLLEENPTVLKRFYNTFLHFILNMLIILIPYCSKFGEIQTKFLDIPVIKKMILSQR